MPVIGPFISYLFIFFTTKIIPYLKMIIGATAVQAGLSFGFGVMTFVGFNEILDRLMKAVITHFGSLPADIVQLLGLMGFDTALNIVFSAMVTLLTLKGLRATGSMSHIVWRKPGSPFEA